MRAPAMLVAAALLAGCAATGETGEGPLALSPPVLAAYGEFRELENPGYFAVPPDGSTFGYSFCADPRCRGHSAGVALWSCNRNRDPADCRIYAYRDKVLWRYPSAWTPPDGFSVEAAAATLPSVPLEGRLVAGRGRFDGRLYLAAGGHYGALELAGLPAFGRCAGVLRRTHAGGGQWEARCAGGAVLMGHYHEERGGAAIRGFAAAGEGARLEFFAALGARR